ncbi:2938_t:CDS:1 [Ambispora gerdemannii]|uniref:2938_t:CDS:1 n=1 Tax=Ambispora gerdemannii TaxID=144530 RepID=A0A9N9EG52_9GLOM|nr:2938_t:CDS:1 [Ambispora gerdemannii]
MDILIAVRFVVRAWSEVSPTTIHNCFRHTGILPIYNNNEELTINDNDNDLTEELRADVESLHLRNEMNIEEYINYPEERSTEEVLTDQEILDLVTYQEAEKAESEEEEIDDSIEMRKITRTEVLDALELMDQYFVQQDFSNAIRLEYDTALSKLHKVIRKHQNDSLKQMSIEAFLE